jgi:hypothetical protein
MSTLEMFVWLTALLALMIAAVAFVGWWRIR